MKLLRVATIYKITYPNGKIYIGQDRTNDVNYFGSADSLTIANDFTASKRDDFTVRKQILMRRYRVSVPQLNELEKQAIKKHRSNVSAIGYNRTHCPRRKCTMRYVRTK